MVDRYGYATGWAIAIAACASFFYAGTLYEAYTAPAPCIVNFTTSIGNHPFAFRHQELINDTEVRTWFKGTPDEVEQSGRDWMQRMIDYVPENGGENAFGNALGTVDQFMQMMMMKTAQDLQVDPTIIR